MLNVIKDCMFCVTQLMVMGLIVLEGLLWGASFDFGFLADFCRLLLNRRNQGTIFVSFDQEENLSIILVSGSQVNV